MKKVNIFLLSILAICSAFVMMTPKSYQSSYAVGNDVIDSFVSVPVNYDMKYTTTTTSNNGTYSVSVSYDSTYNSSYYYQYKITQTNNGLVYSLLGDIMYLLTYGGSDPFAYTNYVFRGVYGSNNSTLGTSFVIDTNYVYYNVVSSVAFWFDVHGTIAGNVGSTSVSYFRCYDGNGVLNSAIPSTFSVANGELYNLSVMVHTIQYSDGYINVYFLVADYLPTETIYVFGSDLAGNEYYSNGYNNGYNSGRQDGYSAGTADGYDNGYNIGYNAGHSAGVLDSNDYSFIGLMGSVIDAPIAGIRGLLNFNILGVDVSAFVFGLFTITIILVIIKKVKGI